MQKLWTALCGAALVATFAAPVPAWANRYDISLRGVGRPVDSTSLTDPAVVRYRKLANELAIAMMPKPLAPAETLGMNGFEFSLASGHTPIHAKDDFWQGQPGTPVLEGIVSGRRVPNALWTPTAHIRKGLPMSTEVGVSAAYLVYSEMFMVGGEVKIALHENYFRWVPALSTRLAFSRLFGAADLDIMTGEVDVLTSLPFGIGGMLQVTPFVGYGMTFVNVNSQVIDDTPHLVSDGADQQGGPQGSLYTFPTIEWSDNRHHRFFVGTRLIAAFFEVILEWDYTALRGQRDLQTYSFKLGFDT